MTERRASLLIGLSVLMFLSLPMLTFDNLGLLGIHHDDAFYYYQVARNVADGEGFTFDGIHATNGFQPLWLFLILPIFGTIPGDFAPLRVVGVVEAALVAIASIMVYRILGPRIGRSAAAAAALLLAALPGSRAIFVSGLESALFLCLLVLVWRLWIAATSDSANRVGWLWLGSAAAAMTMARLESVLIIPILLLLSWRDLRSRPYALMALLLPGALVLAGYMAWNRLAFDIWWPVSGLVKAHWASREASPGALAAAARLPWLGHQAVCRAFGTSNVQLCPRPAIGLYLLLDGLLVGILIWKRRAVIAVVRRAAVALPLIGCTAIVLADLLSVRYLPPWYRGPLVLMTALGIGLAVRTRPALAHAALAAAILLFAVQGSRLALSPTDPSTGYPYYRLQAARWLKSEIGNAERVGSWNAGTLGYFSRRHVINLDGLVNDAEYYRSVTREGNLAEYLSRERIGLLADQSCGTNVRPTVYLSRTGSEHLDESFHLVASFFDPQSPDRCPGYAVWRYRGPDE